MADRKQEVRCAETATTSSQHHSKTVVLTPPSADEESYLKSIERSNSDYDPRVMLGGPRIIRS